MIHSGHALLGFDLTQAATRASCFVASIVSAPSLSFILPVEGIFILAAICAATIYFGGWNRATQVKIVAFVVTAVALQLVFPDRDGNSTRPVVIDALVLLGMVYAAISPSLKDLKTIARRLLGGRNLLYLIRGIVFLLSAAAFYWGVSGRIRWSLFLMTIELLIMLVAVFGLPAARIIFAVGVPIAIICLPFAWQTYGALISTLLLFAVLSYRRPTRSKIVGMSIATAAALAASAVQAYLPEYSHFSMVAAVAGIDCIVYGLFFVPEDELAPSAA